MHEPRDEGDVAQDYQAKHNAAAVADHRARMADQRATPSLMICEDCEGDIPEERRKKQQGCTRCVTCQALHESPKGGM